MSSEPSPQTEEASARDGHSPQGDIAKRRKAKGAREFELDVRFAVSLMPCASDAGTGIPARQKPQAKVKIPGYEDR